MGDLQIDNLESWVSSVPPLPQVVYEVIEQMDRKDLCFRQLSTVIGQDPALAGGILRLANSPFYGLSAQVKTLPQALVVLGVYTIRNLVVALTGMRQMSGSGNDALAQGCAHAMRTAVAAQLVADQCEMDAGVAFTASLLHDLGALLLMQRFPGHYRAVYQKPECSLIEALQMEVETFGVDHTQVGQCLGVHWSLPDCLVTVMGRHHEPNVTDDNPLLHVVRVAIHLADESLSEAGRMAPEDEREALASLDCLHLRPESLDILRQGVSETDSSSLGAFIVGSNS